jgi:hypothetical protein
MTATLSPPVGRIGVERIDLERTEGLHSECVTVTCRSFADAGAVLARWAKTAPPAGDGYHKVRYGIRFADGQTYGGRYDLKHIGVEVPSLRRDVIDSLRFRAGWAKPDWCDEAKYQRILADEPDLVAQARAMLGRYAIGADA